MNDLRMAIDGLAALAAIIERAPVDDVHLTKSLAVGVAGEIRTVLAALASAPAGDGYGKWHPMLLDLVNAIHGDRGEKTQAIGIDLSYQQALAAALARPRAAVGEREAALEAALKRAAVNMTNTPRHNRGSVQDRLIGAACEEIRLALQSPPAKVGG